MSANVSRALGVVISAKCDLSRADELLEHVAGDEHTLRVRIREARDELAAIQLLIERVVVGEYEL